MRWTSKSVRKLAEELVGMGHEVSYPVVAELLREMGYSLQANRKTKEGGSHPIATRSLNTSTPECSNIWIPGSP